MLVAIFQPQRQWGDTHGRRYRDVGLEQLDDARDEHVGEHVGEYGGTWFSVHCVVHAYSTDVGAVDESEHLRALGMRAGG